MPYKDKEKEKENKKNIIRQIKKKFQNELKNIMKQKKVKNIQEYQIGNKLELLVKILINYMNII